VGLKVEVRDNVLKEIQEEEYIKENFKLNIRRLNRWWYSVYFDKKGEVEMKNKVNKQNRLWAKDCFTKQQLLILKKYSRLLSYDMPYDIINRGYGRYLRNLNDYLMVNNYPKHWFCKDKDSFCNSIRTYIVLKEENHECNLYTRGWTANEITKLSGLDKYIDKHVIN
jgi:hypothetical protein